MKKNRKIISILSIIILILIIFTILKIKFYNVNGDLVVIRNINYNIGDLVCIENSFDTKNNKIASDDAKKYCNDNQQSNSGYNKEKKIEEKYQYKITRIISITEENKYITKIDGSLYNDQLNVSEIQIKGVYQFRIKHILEILTSKITWVIILIILISIVIYINKVEKRKKIRKIKKEEVS